MYCVILCNVQDGVFWLAVGKECSDSKDALLAKVDDLNTLKNIIYFRFYLFTNVLQMRMLCDKLGETKAPNSLEHGVDILRTAFMKRTQCLLVFTN